MVGANGEKRKCIQIFFNYIDLLLIVIEFARSDFLDILVPSSQQAMWQSIVFMCNESIPLLQDVMETHYR